MILHDRSIVVRNPRGDYYIGSGNFTEKSDDRRILHFSSIMAAYSDARPANCEVSFWEERDGELVEVHE